MSDLRRPHASIPPGLDAEQMLTDHRRVALVPTIAPEHGPAFDDLARLTVQILDASECFVCLLGPARQLVIGRTGDGPTDWDVHLGFCGATITLGAPLMLGDLQEDREAAKKPDAGFRAYAGVPLRLQGERVGTLCVMNAKPRAWTVEDAGRLSLLGELGEHLLARAG